MKKIYMLFALCLSAFSGFAGGNDLVGLNSKKGNDDGMVSKGFYWHLGVGFPSYKLVDFPDAGRQSQGLQFTVEAGNQWMFMKTDHFGVGMNVSWLTIGGSSYKLKDTDVKVASINLGLLRLGPMATLGIGDNMAFDVFFNVAPTMYYDFVTDDNIEQNTLIYGVAFVPGVKFRFKKLAIGFENNFGRLKAQDLDNSDLNTKVSFMNPRVLIGMKF